VSTSNRNSNKGPGLDPATTEKICKVFACHPEVDMVKLYGSRAKGTFRAGSDIDLVLIGRDLTSKVLNRISNELDDLPLPYSFDVSILSNISNQALISHIERVGRVFYQRGPETAGSRP
jgi:predicted nucleotidyltransferase